MNHAPVNAEIQKVYGDAIKTQAEVEKTLKIKDFVCAPGQILIDPLPPDAVTDGGIVIPDTVQKDKSVGWVIKVHPDDKHGIRPGDLLLHRYGAQAGQGLIVEGKELCLCQWFEDTAGDVLGWWPKDCF